MVAGKLREMGVPTELYTENDKFKKKLVYVNKIGVPFIAIIGDDEVAKKKVSLKNMTTGKQELLDVKAVANKVSIWVDILFRKKYYWIVNTKLVSYILQQKSLKINDEDIKKQLLDSGWSEKEIDSILYSHLDKEGGNKKLQISLMVIGLLTFLGLVFNLVSAHLYDSSIIDPSIKMKNDTLYVEIEAQENILHNVLHSDLEKGNIPISKELAVLFRLTDLLHLQNELTKISDEANYLQNSELLQHNQENIDKVVSEMKNIQEIVSREVYDKTHDGNLDPSWLINPWTILEDLYKSR